MLIYVISDVILTELLSLMLHLILFIIFYQCHEYIFLYANLLHFISIHIIPNIFV